MKKRFPFFWLVIFFFFSTARDIAAEQRPFALVLSGGGARGLAQIGILKAFEQAGIRPSLVVGTSMGALVGSLYCCGYPVDSIGTMIKRFDWNDAFNNVTQRNHLFVIQKKEPVNYLFELRFDASFMPQWPTSVSNGQSLFELLSPALARAQYECRGSFDSLAIPMRIVTTDIISGKRVVLSQGNLAEAVRASCAVPGLFSPVSIDSMLLMDGGLTSNIPVEIARDNRADLVIALDVTSAMRPRQQLDNPVFLADQIVAIGVQRQKGYERSLADLIITPDLHGHVNTDFSSIDSLIEWGYQAAMAALPGLDSLRGSDSGHFNADTPRATSLKQPLLDDPIVAVSGIRISGCEHTSPGFVRRLTDISVGDTISAQDLSTAIGSVYSSELFNTVNMEIGGAGAVKIMLDEKSHWCLRGGLRFDEFHLLEGFVQPMYENIFGYGIPLSLYIQYGPLREKYAIDLSASHIFSRSVASTFRTQLYISRERIVQRIESDDTSVIGSISLTEQTLRKAGFQAIIGTEVWKSAMLSGGLRVEGFKVHESERGLFDDPLRSFKSGLRYIFTNLTVDNLDRYPFPLAGWKNSATIGGATDQIGGSESFVKLSLNAGRYITINKKHTIFTQIQWVWANNTLPDVERVYLGGVLPEERFHELSVYNYIPFIGLAPRSLPGDDMLLLHMSYRYALKEKLFLTPVFDWGTTWEHSSFSSVDSAGDALRNFASDAPFGLGLGIEYNALVGPLRLFWGRLFKNPFPEEWNIKSENLFYISMGHDF